MNWKLIVILTMAVFSATFGNGLVVPLLPVYADGLGATALSIGIIFGAFSVSRTLFLPLFGRWSDRSGRKPFILAGLGLYIGASLAFMGASSVIGLVVIRFFQGIASAMILPVAQAYAGEISPHNREGLIMGIVNVGLYGGLSAGPVLGGIVADRWGIKASFSGMGLVFLLGLIFCLFLLPPRHHEKINPRNRDFSGIKMTLFNRDISGLFLFRVAYTMSIGSLWTFAPLLAHEKFHMSAFSAGFIISLSVLVSAVLMTPLGFVADRGPKRLMIFLGGGITTAAMLCLAVTEHPWQLYTVSVLIGVGGGISVPALMAMTVIAGKKHEAMGTLISLLTMAHSMGLILGPVLAGLLIDSIDTTVAFSGAAVFMAACTVIAMPLTSGFSDLSRRQPVMEIDAASIMD